MSRNLTDITRWSHDVLTEVLHPGGLAVDLTVGNGRDTLFLSQAVGPAGCVVGFEIQPAALEKARDLLASHRAAVTVYEEGDDRPSLPVPGVHLFKSDHAGWPEILSHTPRAFIANLGYLPGGDRRIVTRPESTLAALGAALERLTAGGRIAVVCYLSHEGGREEADAVGELFGGLDRKEFSVLKVDNPPAESSPFLLVAEKV